jgi:hypothetical protein
MRRTSDERAIRLRERLLEALVVSGGELPRSPLRLLACGGDAVYSDELDRALAELVASGAVKARSVDHFVGRSGSGTIVYRAAPVYTALPAEHREDEDMISALQPRDRLALLDVVHAHLEAVRSAAVRNVDAEAQWLRVSSTLIAAEMYQDEPENDADTSAEAS